MSLKLDPEMDSDHASARRRTLDCMWTTESPRRFGPSGTGGYDGEWWKWPLVSGARRTFIVVKIPAHVRVQADDLPTRTQLAVETNGMSEVQLHLEANVPPRVIELSTANPTPRITRLAA